MNILLSKAVYKGFLGEFFCEYGCMLPQNSNSPFKSSTENENFIGPAVWEIILYRQTHKELH